MVILAWLVANGFIEKFQKANMAHIFLLVGCSHRGDVCGTEAVAAIGVDGVDTGIGMDGGFLY